MSILAPKLLINIRERYYVHPQSLESLKTLSWNALDESTTGDLELGRMYTEEVDTTPQLSIVPPSHVMGTAPITRRSEVFCGSSGRSVDYHVSADSTENSVSSAIGCSQKSSPVETKIN